MKRITTLLAVIFLFIFSLAACTTLIPTIDTNSFNTIVAQSVKLTQMAGTMTAMANQPSQQMPTAGVAVAPTETPTLQATAEPTHSGVWLTFTNNTNCRFGPGPSYYLVKTLKQGDEVQAVGRSTDGLYVYVRFTDSSTHYCWVLKEYSVVNGDIDFVPAVTPYPTYTPTITPTSDAGFALSFNGISSCGGNYYVRVLVENTGYLTWQSVLIKVVDNTTGDDMSDTSDTFNTYGLCALDEIQADLTTGEPAIITNFNKPFGHDLDNHSLTITVKLYSKDGEGGINKTQSITVTP